VHQFSTGRGPPPFGNLVVSLILACVFPVDFLVFEISKVSRSWSHDLRWTDDAFDFTGQCVASLKPRSNGVIIVDDALGGGGLRISVGRWAPLPSFRKSIWSRQTLGFPAPAFGMTAVRDFFPCDCAVSRGFPRRIC